MRKLHRIIHNFAASLLRGKSQFKPGSLVAVLLLTGYIAVYTAAISSTPAKSQSGVSVSKQNGADNNSAVAKPSTDTLAINSPSNVNAASSKSNSSTSTNPSKVTGTVVSTVASTTSRASTPVSPVSAPVTTSPPTDAAGDIAGPPTNINGPTTLNVDQGSSSTHYVASTIDGSSVLWQPQNIPGMPSPVYISTISPSSGLSQAYIFQVVATNDAVVGPDLLGFLMD